MCALHGLHYAKEEPGLFHTRASQSPTVEQTVPPAPTNPKLPVAAEAEWTTAEGLKITTRFAIHAVRRLEDATVVDWSVTPLGAPGFGRGDRLPSWVDLGLSRTSEGDINMFLLDPAGGKVYRTLSHQSRRLFNRCLCTPLWLAQQGLRIGETRLLQASFPPLPAALDFIDVDMINMARSCMSRLLRSARSYPIASDGPGSGARRRAPDPCAASLPIPPGAAPRTEHRHRPGARGPWANITGMDDQVG
jgi:hypothetical protein